MEWDSEELRQQTFPLEPHIYTCGIVSRLSFGDVFYQFVLTTMSIISTDLFLDHLVETDFVLIPYIIHQLLRKCKNVNVHIN